MPPLETLLPFFAQSGVFGLIVWLIRNTHRDAIQAHKDRADDWRAAAKAHEARADDLQKQLVHILGAVKTTAGT